METKPKTHMLAGMPCRRAGLISVMPGSTFFDLRRQDSKAPLLPQNCFAVRLSGEEVVALRRESVDEAALFERLHAVPQIGRHDEGAALPDDLDIAVDRHLEGAF